MSDRTSRSRDRRRRTRGWLTGLITGLAAALTLGLAGSAAAETVDIPAEIVVRSQAIPGPNDPGRCVAWAFLQFSETAGATRYEGKAFGHLGSSDVVKSGPPFADDHFSDFPAVFDAPAGSHWFALGGGSTGAGCAAAEAGLDGHFTFGYMHAEIPDPPQNQAPIAAFSATPNANNPRRFAFNGTGSSDSDGRIVAYSWTFGDGGTATGPSPNHTYTGGGRRTVTLTVTDDDGAVGSTSRTVAAPFDVRGTLSERFCGPSSCRLRPAADVQVSASGEGSTEAVTDGRGRYRLLLTPGAWTITPLQAPGTNPWDPPSRDLDVSSDMTGQDFARCGEGAPATPPGGFQAAAVGDGTGTCVYTLEGTIRTALDDIPFGRAVRSFHGETSKVQFRLAAFDEAGQQVASDVPEEADGRFLIRVPAGRYRLRFTTPEPAEPIQGLPNPGLPVVADRNRTGLVVRVRPTLGTLSTRSVAGGVGFEYSLEVFDTVPFGHAAPSADLLLDRVKPVPLLWRNVCSGQAVGHNSLGTVAGFLFPRPVPQGPGFLGPDIDVPLCGGEYRGSVILEGSPLATFRVTITGGELPDAPLTEVRYQGRFRG
jgi:hypothetical protein